MGRPRCPACFSIGKQVRSRYGSVGRVLPRWMVFAGLVGALEVLFGLHPSWSRLRRQTAAQGIVAVGQ